MITKRNRPKAPVAPYYLSNDIHVYFEFPFGNDIIKPGDKIKIRGVRGWFKFMKVAHNSKLDVTWIDCMSTKDGTWRSFYIDRLLRVDRPKRSYRKKISR